MPGRRGVWIFVLVVTLLGAIVLAAALQLRKPAESQIASGSIVLDFDLPDEIEEAQVPFRPFGRGLRAWSRPTVYEVLTGLREAAEDDRVKGIIVHVGDLDWGWVKAYEVHDALDRFRETGKPVYVSLSRGAELEYLIASSGSLITMPPIETLYLDGLSVTALFYKGTFDKLGITPNFAQSGRYKSGVEPYVQTGLSPASREAMDSLLDDQYRQLATMIGESLDVSADSARVLLEGGPYTGQKAVDLGLVDTLVYEADLDSLLKDDLDDDVHTVDFDSYLKRARHTGGHQHIAYVAAAGEILPGRSDDRPGDDQVLGSETMVELLGDLTDKSSVKAVVLRVDSPGGVIEPSDEIWRAVERLAAAKPVIVSMSDLDASGGYYLSSPATRIVAHPASITGSIGVYGGKLNVVGLMNKVGLSVETLSRGRRASMMSPFTDFTPDEARLFKQHMDAGYRTFLSRVADGRGFSMAWADSVGQGRVWSGASAYELGLADTLGGIETAIEVAMQEIDVKNRSDISVEVYPKVEMPWYARFFQDIFEDETPGVPRLDLPPAARAWIDANSRNAALVLTRMPFNLRIR